MVNEIRDYLSGSVRLMAISVEDELNKEGWSSSTIQPLAKRLGNTVGLRVTIIDRQGKVWGDSRYNPALMGNHKKRPEIKLALSGKAGESIRFSSTLKTPLWYRAVPIIQSHRIVGAVRVAKLETEIQRILDRLRAIFYLSLLGIIVLVGGVGLYIMGRMTQPLLELERLTKQFASGNLSGRARDLGPNELGILGNTLNQMADRLSHSIETMREEKQRLQVILENMDDGLLAFDTRHRLVIINRAGERLLGLDRSKVIGRTVPELLVHPALEEWMNEAFTRNMPVGGEFESRIPEPRNIYALAAPIEDEPANRSHGGTIVLLRDLTLQRRLEQVRQDFVANVSHELRTPVTAVRVMAEALTDSIDDEERRNRFVQGIIQETDRMTRIVDDLLTLAKADAGKGFQEPYKPFKLNELIREVVLNIGSKTGHRISVDLPATLPLVAAHEERIRQVLVNLIENAQKYTPNSGEITITAQPEENYINVRVSDTGPGIPLSEQERIFERFYRIDKARSRAQGGTGLGLSIVKHIVEGYGGRVWVESKIGRGATFFFTLPVVSAES